MFRTSGWLFFLCAFGCVPDALEAPEMAEKSAKAEATLPEVHVNLGESVDKLKGMTWPKERNGELVRQAVLARSCKVTVHFPSGRHFTLVSTSLFIIQQNSRMCDVSLSPLFGPRPFREVTAEVGRIIKELKVKESGKVVVPFAKWKEPAERFYNCVTGGRVEKGVDARFEVKAVGDEGGWMAILTLTIPKLYGIQDDEIERDD